MNVKRSGYLWELYPDFNRRTVFCLPPKSEAYKNWSLQDVSTLGKCVVTYSDPTGPMRDERDITMRLKGTLNYMDIKSGKVYDEIMSIGRLFLDMTHAYYEMIYSLDYELWISSKMQLHNFMAKLRAPIGDTEKSTDLTARRGLMKEVEEMTADVLRIEMRVFKDATLMKRLAEHISGKDSLEGYAEEFAIPIDDLISKEYEDIFS